MANYPTYGNLPTAEDPTAWAGRTIPTPLTIDAIQNQIAAQLTAFFTGQTVFPTVPALPIDIYVWPNFDLDTWWGNTSRIAFVLISYSQTDLDKPLATSSMVQERTLTFKVHVEARQIAWKLTGPGSVYALIDAIEAALTGFRPSGCRNAYFTNERFSEQDPQGRVWLHDLSYNVITLKGKLEPYQILADLQQVTTNVQPGGDVVSVPPAVPPINVNG